MSSTLPSRRTTHQTALVIDVREGITPTFRNRYNRLIESVNGANIKCEVFTLRDEPGTTNGDAFTYGGPDATSSNEDDDDKEFDIANWATEQGFNMLVVATPVGGGLPS